ncbi:peptidase domain-containing ABC transporter [Lyngbya sp. PCC 8106]|uniref:peptidase domain-containing ABC transporter n=1 Tax=Lyngbya sp. (strain PCC 8106) TaxID=313612 RepID=UPI0000EAA0F7|nr:peptidase domain-containing ABC transporter [Lyngbya sp. PCC 8106]EAW38127.1 toxin secretion ABC transporter ATP-binding protein [Lyngbya sp. PCC 8106]
MTTTTVSHTQIRAFLEETSPFDRLSESALKAVLPKCQLLGYRTGQPIFEREKMPTQVSIIYQGQARLLGYDLRTQRHMSLRLLGAGEILGWPGLIRGNPCETAIASTDMICITLAAEEFLQLVSREPSFGEAFRDHASISEVFELLSQEVQQRANLTGNLKEFSLDVWPDAIVVNLLNGQKRVSDLTAMLDPERVWLISNGTIGEWETGNRLQLEGQSGSLKIEGPSGVRLVGLRPTLSSPPETPEGETPTLEKPADIFQDIPLAPPTPPEPEIESPSSQRFPVVRGSGQIDAPLACFNMLSKFYKVNFRKDLVKRVLENQLTTVGSISLQACGAVAQMMGLNAQLVQVPAKAIGRLKAPAMVVWQDSFAILYNITERELTIATPERGLKRMRPAQFGEVWGESGQVLLLQPPKIEQKEQFSFWWFWPALMEHRTVFVEVLLSSFFVQLFGLVNPLMTMIIIDKVLGQRNIDALNILGILMLGVALFEALLSALRTYLFVDTTNRLDVRLSAEVIDHLLRLPLNYFDNRRVGDLVGRIGELANIRSFLTGTALTVVLDAVFSVVYVAMMFYLSVPMAIVALAPLPLFAGIIIINSPIVRRLLRKKAERYADSQSYLVEVLNGIQTVKAQNIELKSRWEWQGRYARFMSASFNTILTQTASSSISNFLNKLSGLALLWVGAYLVIDNKLTIGALIAFRIIAGNVTGSLLRFVSVWQSFQEVGMSVERLRDVLDSPPEVDSDDRNNIPMPEVNGEVTFEEVSFRFGESGPLQVANVNLEFPAGSFVGIVGLSGSGKSTLMKLLQRLYPPMSGRIKIDGYDITKVEMYSLRRQIGVVLQDTLLFNGTVQDNIALSNPDAGSDEIVRAAKIAAAHEFIMGLPNGYNTVVGERGGSLSGGQRQRIAIARTVLQNPRLLILDEATSALDYQSERLVSENLEVAFEGRTVFFITHRLPTVRNADCIIMMDQGSVVEQGSHDELMALKGRYYCLFQQQESQQ